jgi:hypothetical protein
MSITTVDLGSPVAYTPAVTRPLERLRKENATLRMERDFAKKVIMPAGAGTGDRMRIGAVVRSRRRCFLVP